ncbi:PH domain-containing protein [Macrococcus armenti]|uniref:PH domain-containing protein n=1 Tax=Macrococcus armenti TaxID=2875764 RepID=UPI001CCA42EE|nr:PH domain-containing protein [Macrococcus armenti]UBH08368.1 PH domain-containing protein [Macrococcus armenti]UBH10655.1 PH domain-containing protein [Macrococcus armenti]UBH15136.1 PH domain-containing protein [Macrococcus armenti]UBH17497.1 PH domain-containing protein [Macrococcus armenti]UBH19761.1 PH domain-containing protein [Macrococcus armenti]
MKQMHKSSIKVLRIGALIQAVLFAVAIAIFYGVKVYFELPISHIVFIVLCILLLLDIVWYIFIRPALIYHANYYEIGTDEIILCTGIWNKEQVIVPYVTIQNVETEQGPIMKRSDIMSLTVHTAENGLTIPLVHKDEAHELKRFINEKLREMEFLYDQRHRDGHSGYQESNEIH